MIMPRVKSRLFCFTILLTKRLYLLLINTLDGLAGVAWQTDISRARLLLSGELTVWIESFGLMKSFVVALAAAEDVGSNLVTAAKGAAYRRSLFALVKFNASAGVFI
jgi:hypothetical protein